MKGNIQVQNRKLSSLIANIPGNPYLYIYSGTMPTASDSFTTSTYTSSQLLAFTLSGGWYGYDTTDTAYTSFYMTQFPASAPASLSGTASWFCLYSSPTIFVLGDVSDTTEPQYYSY